jgi:hypothetical protein
LYNITLSSSGVNLLYSIDIYLDFTDYLFFGISPIMGDFTDYLFFLDFTDWG